MKQMETANKWRSLASPEFWPQGIYTWSKFISAHIKENITVRRWVVLENQAQSWNMHILIKKRDGTESLVAPEMGERLIKGTGVVETRERLI